MDSLSENEFQQAIVQAATLQGWRCFFIPDWIWRIVFKSWREGGSRRGREWSAAGFPDCVFIRNGHLLFAELKSQKGKIRDPQKEWHEDLLKVDRVSARIWRPSDYDEILEILENG